MTFAIFWLPLVAAVLLGGLAFAAWYGGGSKTLAVWAGFIGVTCFVLTAALQLQQHVWTEANQPHLTMVPTKQWFLRWDPPRSYQLQVNDEPNPPEANWKAPQFLIRNSAEPGQDATIKWGASPYQAAALVGSSDRLKGHVVSFTQNEVIMGPKSRPPLPWASLFSLSESISVPFLTKETVVYIPVGVWDQAALFFVATLSDAADAKSEPFFFDALVSWNIPADSKPKQFRIKATARNVKLAGTTSPAFLAAVDFEIAEGN